MGIMKYSRLGDTFFEDKAKKINQALEKINAPYYQVCKKVRGAKANKDAYDISWRKRNITCDDRYPNATTTGEKVVMRQLEKNFGISLSLLNSDTPRAIKKSLDFQKAQQTIIDNKIKARQERERAAAERKALRNAPKTKTTTKTTTTKSIPSSERNDNKESANRQNEILTEKNENITYFYAIVKNGRRKNYAKLNTLTNRVQYLTSAVPIYVKEYIKSFKSGNVKAVGKTTKEDKKVETDKYQNYEFGKTKLTDKIEEVKDTVYKFASDKLLKQNYSITKVYYSNQYGHHWGYNIRNTKTQKHVGDMKITIDNGDFHLTLAEVGFYTDDLDKLNDVRNNKSKTQSGSIDSLKRPTKIAMIKESIDEFLDIIKEKSSPAKEEKSNDLYLYKLGISEELFEIVEVKAKRYGYTLRIKDNGDNWKSYSIIGKRNSYQGVVRIDIGSPIDKEIEDVKLFEISLQSGDVRTGITERIKDRIEDLKQYDLIRVINNQVNKFFESVYFKEYGKKDIIEAISPEYVNPQYTKVKATDFARKMGIEVNEIKPINEPETTEIIKEPAPIMIDEDEAAKFDKGLDELTKLLQQAMQG